MNSLAFHQIPRACIVLWLFYLIRKWDETISISLRGQFTAQLLLNDSIRQVPTHEVCPLIVSGNGACDVHVCSYYVSTVKFHSKFLSYLLIVVPNFFALGLFIWSSLSFNIICLWETLNPASTFEFPIAWLPSIIFSVLIIGMKDWFL